MDRHLERLSDGITKLRYEDAHNAPQRQAAVLVGYLTDKLAGWSQKDAEGRFEWLWVVSTTQAMSDLIDEFFSEEGTS